MADIIRETDEYVRYDIDFDEIVDAAQQVEAAAEGYDDLDTRLNDMDTTIAGKASATHTHASNAVTAMTGYSMPSSTSAISASDTLNAAVGKLEKGVDVNKTNISSLETLKSFNCVYRAIATTSITHTYTMSLDDFAAGSSGERACGMYIISAITWATPPAQSLFLICYSGGSTSNAAITKIAGADTAISTSGATISITTSGKVQIFALI